MSELLFLDDSGFTGEDLFNPDQPVFVLATLLEAESQCAVTKADVFGRVAARELKHTDLCRRPRQQRLVADLIRTLARKSHRVKFSFAHKRYVLVCQMVDWLVETAMHEDGIDLYERGGNIALSNVLFHCLPTFGGVHFFDTLLLRFQEMMRLRTPEAYRAFFGPLFENSFGADLKQLLLFLQGFHIHPRCGYPRLLTFPPRLLDIPMTCALALMGLWRSSLTETVELIHDRSSSMARESATWATIVDPSAPSALVGFDRRTMEFPLRVARTRFEESHQWVGLQLADVLAGAFAYRLRWHLGGRSAADAYGSMLDALPWEDFGGHSVWPRAEVTPEELNTTGPGGDDPLAHYALLMKRAGLRTGR